MLLSLCAVLFAQCSSDSDPTPTPDPVPPVVDTYRESIILLNEGNWQSDNAKVTLFEDGKIVSNQWFRDVNGYKIGDTPNDIIRINDNLIAIAVNWSNIIQFITPDGKAVAATEDVPNNRRLSTDGKFVYVTSYGHECITASGKKTFTKGFVAKINAETFKVVDATEVGYEPEGIAYYKGRLYVANTGGYSAQEQDHDYEHTVTVLDAATMQKGKDIDVKVINLFGEMSQTGQYLCINSGGDFYNTSSATVILDCESDRFVTLPFAATNNCTTTDGKFFAVGSTYSYVTGMSQFSCYTIDPAKVMATGGKEGVSDGLPGTIMTDMEKMIAPYSIYVNPYTGYIYATDAGTHASAGYLYQWTPEGTLLGKHKVYINPAHLLALPKKQDEK